MSIVAYGKFPNGFHVGSDVYQGEPQNFKHVGDLGLIFRNGYNATDGVLGAGRCMMAIHSALLEKSNQNDQKPPESGSLVTFTEGGRNLSVVSLGTTLLDTGYRPVKVISVMVDEALRAEDSMTSLHDQMSWDYIIDPVGIDPVRLPDDVADIGFDDSRELIKAHLL